MLIADFKYLDWFPINRKKKKATIEEIHYKGYYENNETEIMSTYYWDWSIYEDKRHFDLINCVVCLRTKEVR